MAQSKHPGTATRPTFISLHIGTPGTVMILALRLSAALVDGHDWPARLRDNNVLGVGDATDSTFKLMSRLVSLWRDTGVRSQLVSL